MMYFFAFLIMIAAVLSLFAHGIEIRWLGFVLDVIFFCTGIAMIIRIETKRRSREKETLQIKVQQLESKMAKLEKVTKTTRRKR